jgi:hypothetical protein
MWICVFPMKLDKHQHTDLYYSSVSTSTLYYSHSPDSNCSQSSQSNPDGWTIQLGVTRRHAHAFFGQKMKVRRVVSHPMYNMGVAHDNDVALFQVCMNRNSYIMHVACSTSIWFVVRRLHLCYCYSASHHFILNLDVLYILLLFILKCSLSKRDRSSHSSKYEDDCLLSCCPVYSGKSLLIFQRCLLPPLSGLSQQEPLKHQSTSTWLHDATIQKTVTFKFNLSRML